MNMERYKEELNNIHAPEDLILRTLARVHEEEKKVEAEKNIQATASAQQNQQAFSNITNIADRVNNDNTNRENNNSDTTNSNYRNYAYYGLDEPDESLKYPVKKTFYEKHSKFIKIGSTIAAAAAVLFIALSMQSRTGSYSPASDSTTSYSAESTEASADSFDEETAEEAAEEAVESEDMMETADESAKSENSVSSSQGASSSAAADTDSVEGDDYAEEESDGAVSDISPNGYVYNYINTTRTISASDTYKTKNSLNARDSFDSDEITLTEPFKTLSIEEYSEYLGIDIQKYLDILPVSSELFAGIIDEENGKLEDDLSYLTFDVSPGKACLEISQNRVVGIEKLLEQEPTMIDDTKVYICETQNPTEYYAMFEKEGIHFSLRTLQLSKADFEQYIKIIIEQ